MSDDKLKCDDCGSTDSVLEYKGYRFTALICRECRNKIPSGALAAAAPSFKDPQP